MCCMQRFNVNSGVKAKGHAYYQLIVPAYVLVSKYLDATGRRPEISHITDGAGT
jgi:hypothetical protein